VNWWETTLACMTAVLVVPWLLILAYFPVSWFVRYTIWVRDVIEERWG